MIRIPIHASKDYSVLVARGILHEAGRHIRAVLGDCRVTVVADDTVDALYGDTLRASLDGEKIPYTTFVFPHGEASKTMTTLASLLEFLAEAQMTRKDAIVALGGGVTGDLSGFAAACYLRGIRYIGIPTTLLAAVDSSVGGKTAVDLAAGKNLAGAFWQPSLVLCDPDTLSTLPPEVFSDGMAEVIKYGVISDADLLPLLAHPDALPIEDVIARCVAAKARLVEADEGDRGVRKLLNFGHTAGHAIERESNFTLMHGHAVAIGMMMATRYAIRLGMIDGAAEATLASLLTRCNLPTVSPYPREMLRASAMRDKKREGGEIDLVLPKKIGECVLCRMPIDALSALLSEGNPL